MLFDLSMTEHLRKHVFPRPTPNLAPNLAPDLDPDLDPDLQPVLNAIPTHMQVPRMLFDLLMTDRLREYVDARKEPALYKWWAQYSESSGSFDKVRLTYTPTHILTY